MIAITSKSSARTRRDGLGLMSLEFDGTHGQGPQTRTETTNEDESVHSCQPTRLVRSKVRVEMTLIFMVKELALGSEGRSEGYQKRAREVDEPRMW